MIFLHMDSEHYEWAACGKTIKEAQANLLQAWNKRAKHNYDNIETLNEMYGVRVYDSKKGNAWQDGGEINLTIKETGKKG